MKKYLFFLAISALTLSSCKKDQEELLNEQAQDFDFRSGALVSNEGAFGASNASVSWVSEGMHSNAIFQHANEIALGDVLQSVAIHNNRAYAVVNNSQKVEVVDLKDFSSLGTITGCDYPRYFLGIDNNKGYLSNGALNGEVLVVDLNDLSIVSSIAVGGGPEQMVYNGNYVFVANSGGWGDDSTVSVIDPNTDEVVNTLSVGDRPTDLVVDANNEVWVICSGATEYDENWQIVGETPSFAAHIAASGDEVLDLIQLGEVGDHLSQVAISDDGSELYFLLNGVQKMNINGTLGELVIAETAHSIDVDPSSGNIYLTTTPDYISNEEVRIYSPEGVLLRTVEVGIAPNGLVFYE